MVLINPHLKPRKEIIAINGFFLFLIIIWIAVAVTVHGEMTGRQVIEEQERRHKVQSEFTLETMLLVDRSGSKRKRLIKRYSKDIAEDLERSLLVFVEPPRVRGTALLRWEREDREDDQWLYLPSLKKLRRIAQATKKSYFMGTDFTYGDMESEEPDNHNYDVLRSDAVDGHDCYVIEAVPIDQKKKESGYSKRRLWIRKDIFFTLKIEFYDRRGRYIKTLTNHKLGNLEGMIWRPRESLMDNHKRKHKTLIRVITEKINIPINNSVFTERYLMSGRHLE